MSVLAIGAKDKKKSEWKQLFDGKSLKGWHKYNGGEVTGWSVKDGLLYNSGTGSDHGGDIVTDEEFGDFVLYVEWKIDLKSNSGIFYKVVEGKEDAIYKTGIEYQLLDDKNWPDKLEAHQYTGANYAMNAPKGAVVKPLDQFNVSKIIVKGTHVEHWLNDVKVVKYILWNDQWKANKEHGKWKEYHNYGLAKIGKIGLQDHGGLTIFKVIKIKKLK